MKHRDETAETAGLPGLSKVEDPSRTRSGTSQGPGTEDARRDGRIWGRNRWFMHIPGYSASTPLTTSMISLVMAAWRTRFMDNVN